MLNYKLASLLDMGVSHAMLRLSEHCKFQPFGVTMNLSGEIVPTVARAGGQGDWTPEEIHDMSVEIYELASHLKIQSLCICQEIPFESGFAIACTLEDSDLNAYSVRVPFTRERETESVNFMDPIFEKSTAHFFPLPRKEYSFRPNRRAIRLQARRRRTIERADSVLRISVNRA